LHRDRIRHADLLQIQRDQRQDGGHPAEGEELRRADHPEIRPLVTRWFVGLEIHGRDPSCRTFPRAARGGVGIPCPRPCLCPCPKDNESKEDGVQIPLLPARAQARALVRIGGLLKAALALALALALMRLTGTDHWGGPYEALPPMIGSCLLDQ